LNLLTRDRAPEELLHYCNEHGVKIVAYQPLQNVVFFKGLAHPEIEEIAKKYGVSIQQIGLNWLVKHKGVLTIPKAINPEHINENLQSLAFEIAVADLLVLDGLA
jgi:diketogulonate reductase-like aldo/keto reductase